MSRDQRYDDRAKIPHMGQPVPIEKVKGCPTFTTIIYNQHPSNPYFLPAYENIKTLPSQSFYVFIIQSKRATGRKNYN